MNQRRKAAWTKWRKILREQERSGQTVAAFCRERGLCAPHFFQWKKRAAEAAASPPPAFVGVRVAEAGGERGGGAIELALGGGRTLRIEPGFDAGHLRGLLQALEGGE